MDENKNMATTRGTRRRESSINMGCKWKGVDIENNVVYGQLEF